MNIINSKINYVGTISLEKQAILSFLGSPGFLCLLGSRMFLNLKEAGEAEVNEGTSIPSVNNPASNIGDPQFEQPSSSSSGSSV